MRHTQTRCFPTYEAHPHYERIAAVIRYLQTQRQQQPGLAELARIANMSEHHLQRTFKAFVGLTPKQFLQVLNKEFAKQRLKQQSVLDTALETGLSGSGRLHDLMLRYEAVTPGEFKSGGAGVKIVTGWHESAFGHLFVAQTARGIVQLQFADTAESQQRIEETLRLTWPNAAIETNAKITGKTMAPLLAPSAGEAAEIKLLLAGTPFQIKVWEALLAIPYGAVRSYQQVATTIAQPSASRAVAAAIARNHIAYLIPCHRVIRGSGECHQYRWSSERKQALLAWECAQAKPEKADQTTSDAAYCKDSL